MRSLSSDYSVTPLQYYAAVCLTAVCLTCTVHGWILKDSVTKQLIEISSHRYTAHNSGYNWTLFSKIL